MKKLFQIGLLLMLATTAVAQESPFPKPPKVLREFNWKDLAMKFPDSHIVSMDGISVLKIENTNGQPLELTLLQITNPLVIEKASSLSCDMKYEDVGFRPVEHTNRFGFSGSVIPMRSYWTQESAHLKLLQQLPPSTVGGDDLTNESNFPFDGASNWKPFRFDIEHVLIERGVSGSFEPVPERLPKELKMTLFLPTNGIVYLRPIKLLALGGSNWWSTEQAGAIGGIGGAIIGCLGGLIGLLASKGRARNFVLPMIKIFIVLGIFLLIAGVVAIALQQTYDVWYSLLLPGFILTLVFSLNLPSIQRRYDELEIRRMTSIDASGS